MEESNVENTRPGCLTLVRPRDVCACFQTVVSLMPDGITLERLDMTISKIEDAIEAVRRGEMVVVVDNQDRENEGDLVIAADAADPKDIAFMMNHARGLICVAMEGERLDTLDIPLMVARNTESLKTAFTVSVDYIPGTTTGISAGDRAATVRALAAGDAKPDDFARPGHVFPLRAHPQGVRARAGHTEAAVELARLAGRVPAGAICEVANDDGTMARLPQLKVFAQRHGLVVVTIEDLITFLNNRDQMTVAA